MKTFLMLASLFVSTSVAHAQVTADSLVAQSFTPATFVRHVTGVEVDIHSATFNVALINHDTDVLFGTSSSGQPSFTRASFSFYRNGIEYAFPYDGAAIYDPIVHYDVPSSGVVISNVPWSTFELNTNNMIVIPVTVEFLFPSGSMDAYGVKINTVSWMANGIEFTTAITGDYLTAGSVPSGAIPEPWAYAVILGILTLGFTAWRRLTSPKMAVTCPS
jgi:hypothetical protein